MFSSSFLPAHTHTQYKNPDIYIYTLLGYNDIFPRIVIVHYHCKSLDRGGEGEEGKQNPPIQQQQTTENKDLQILDY